MVVVALLIFLVSTVVLVSVVLAARGPLSSLRTSVEALKELRAEADSAKQGIDSARSAALRLRPGRDQRNRT